MPRTAKLLLQGLLCVTFATGVGYCSQAPVYRHLDPESALIRLSFSHAAARREPCRRLTPDELAALPPNMRRPTECERARLDLTVEFELDGQLLFSATVPPSGLAHDGVATVYEKFPVAPGRHALAVRLRDTARATGFDYEQSRTVDLEPGRNFVIDFSPSRGGFEFR
jgi:hypothetical protein